MRVLVDTNVILDVLLMRDPWVGDAAKIWKHVEDGSLLGFVTATTITDIHYVAARLAGREKAMEAVQVCLAVFEVVNVDRASIERAIQFRGVDFEDDLQVACAESVNAVAIVTRDKRGFAESNVAIWTPKECLLRVESIS